MIVYHGSIEQVEKPEIREASRTLDYGNGFYTTTSEEQAVLWVKRKLKGTGVKGYVNVYELNEGGLLNKQELIKELKTYVLVDQLLFHTPRSLACLRYKEAKEVGL